jgi:cell division protein FtsL
MISKSKKNKRESHQTLFFSVFLGVLLFTVLAFLIISNWQMGQKRAELNLRLETLQKELQSLEERRDALQAQISQTSQESYLEEEAREKFNLKKPGEEVATVLPAQEEETQETEQGWWGKMWNKIKFW